MAVRSDRLRKSYLQIALAGLAGLGLTSLIAYAVGSGERARARELFQTVARARATALQEHFESREHLLEMIEALFEASTQVTPREFDSFLESMPPRQGILSAYWLPRSEGDPQVAYDFGHRCGPGVIPELTTLARELLARPPIEGEFVS